MQFSSELEDDQPDLTRRYRIEVRYDHPENGKVWETVASMDEAIEAVRGCSQCYAGVEEMLDQPGLEGLIPEQFVEHRVVDSRTGETVLWEDELGKLRFESSCFEGLELQA